MPQRMKFHKRKSGKKPPRKQVLSYGPHWKNLRKKILTRDNWQCQKCGRICQDRWEAQVDHIVAKRDGGSDSEENLETLCLTCHGRKSREEAIRWGTGGAAKE
jgi:5-methylcytosine-specific restriction protein A